MRWFREHKIFSVVAGIVIVLLLITFGAYASGSGSSVGNGFRSLFTTVQKPFSYIGGGIKNAYNGIFSYDELQEENEALKKENEELKREVNSNAVKKDELERLEKLWSALSAEPFGKDVEAVSGNVISIDNSSGYREFTVDVGENKGVSVGNLVIDENGIVGVVSAVDNKTAKISSIVDSSIKLSFVLKKNMDLVGIIRGDGDNGLEGYMVNEKSNVAEGDIILTSGMGNFPRGIAIGKVSKVYYDNGKQLKVVKVRPTSEFKTMQKVAIVK